MRYIGCSWGRRRCLPTFSQPLRMARTSFTILQTQHTWHAYLCVCTNNILVNCVYEGGVISCCFATTRYPDHDRYVVMTQALTAKLALGLRCPRGVLGASRFPNITVNARHCSEQTRHQHGDCACQCQNSQQLLVPAQTQSLTSALPTWRG